MEQKRKNFKELLKFGEEGEHEVAKILLSKNISIMPLYQFNNEGHAPFIASKTTKIISPDLICFGDKAFMVEVKTKTKWVVFKNNIETGIDARLYRQYLKVKRATNLDVFLFFNHKISGDIGLFACELEKYTRYWDGKTKNKKVFNEMFFYNKNILKKIV